MRKLLTTFIFITALALASFSQVTSNVFVQTTNSGDFASLTTSLPLIFNLADFSWYYWNGSAYVIYPAVQSVNARNGAVVLTSADVGLGNADNTSDVNKPVSTAQQTALNAKEATANKDATGGYAGLTLFKINFKNAANTFTNFFTNTTTAARTYTFQDRNGTVADDTDLALKAALAGPTFTGIPAGPTAAVDTNTTQLATTAYVVGNGYSKAASPTFSGTMTETAVTDNFLNRTITAIGTTGNVTINKPAGTVNFAAGAGTAGVTVTSSITTVNSIIATTVRTNDATCSIKNVVASAGSFIIRMTANCTAATSIGFIVTN